jgi:hypothetical protein
LLAAIMVNGDAGHDTLIIDDRNDLSGDTVLITESSIDGNTAASGVDIQYSNIDVLDVTATQGDDVLDANFAPGSDLDSVLLSGWTGDDQFLLTTSDEEVGGPSSGIQVIGLFGDAPGDPNPADGSDVFGQRPATPLPGTPAGPGERPIRPSVSTRIDIDGGRPSAAAGIAGDQPLDVLNLDVSALGPPILLATAVGPGQPSAVQTLGAAPSHQPVSWVEIEDLNLADRGVWTAVAMGDLYIRGSDAVDTISFLATRDPLVAGVRVNAFQGSFAVPGRIVVDARGGNDYVMMGSLNRPAEIYGGAGDDYLSGYLADDKLVGGPGRDRVHGGGGENILWGDDDPVAAGLPDTQVNRQLLAAAGPGPLAEPLYADILSSDSGHDTVYGGPAADQITTGGGDDWALGGHGNDTIGTSGGNDRLYGGDGNDNLGGGEGHDVLNGGAGNDVLNALTGHDVLIGGTGDDTLSGDQGRDLLLDGAATYGGAASESQSAGDDADLAMQALLADWLADFVVSGVLTNDHAGLDKLRGGLAEADTFWTGAPAELLDFELALDRLLSA